MTDKHVKTEMFMALLSSYNEAVYELTMTEHQAMNTDADEARVLGLHNSLIALYDKEVNK